MPDTPPFDSYVVAILANAIITTRPAPTAEEAVKVYEEVLAAISARPSSAS
jgi:hypothetical protein